MYVKKRAYCARFPLWFGCPKCRSTKKCWFLRSDGGDCRPDYWFLSHDKKRIRFLSAILVGATWPMSLPVALLFSLF